MSKSELSYIEFIIKYIYYWSLLIFLKTVRWGADALNRWLEKLGINDYD